MKYIADHEMRLNAGGASAFFRARHCQRSHVDAGYLKSLLSQPDTIRSRAAAYIKCAARLNWVSTQNTLQFRGRPPCVPRQVAVPIAIVPFDVLCHRIARQTIRLVVVDS